MRERVAYVATSAPTGHFINVDKISSGRLGGVRTGVGDLDLPRVSCGEAIHGLLAACASAAAAQAC